MVRIYKALGVVALIVSLGPASTANAASEVFCDGYAEISVFQYRKAVSLGKSVSFPHWHDSFDLHKWWCLLNSELAAADEVTAREDVIR